MDTEIILKITTDYYPFIEFIHKFADYVDHNMYEKTGIKVALEPIFKGVLFIFKDFEKMITLHQKGLKFFEQKIITKNNIPNRPHDTTFTSQNFPKNGFLFKIECTGEAPEETISFLQGIYTSIDSTIKIKSINRNEIEIVFPVYESIVNFRLFWRGFFVMFNKKPENIKGIESLSF
jgi:hypothetical protein